MKRLAVVICALECALVLPGAVLAAQPKTASRRSPAGARLVRHQASGTIIATDWASFTIQNGGRRMAVIDALTASANVVNQGDYPYVYGGGHAEAGAASIGIKGPGYNGRTVGFDCSGSVAAVLAGGGLWPVGSGVPADNGIITQLLSEKLIARGPGQGPVEVTLYDDPGVHIFINIDGRFFGTSDGAAGNASQPNGGAGWLDDGAPDASSRAYKSYHVLLSALKRTTSYGPSLTFQLGSNPNLVYGFGIGAKVQVSYTQATGGSLTALAVSAGK